MIASARVRPYEDRFLEMLPQIQDQARFAFRDEPASRRQELVAETIANCWVAYVRLVERGLLNVIYPTPLVQFAIRQVRDGRRVGTSLNANDVSSEYAQRCRGFRLEALEKYNQRKEEWKEVLVEDKRAGPAETAASRLDFADWLQLLPRRARCIARTLALGETTKKAAKRYRVSPSRISQLRRQLQQNWQDFQGEASFA